ETGADATGIAQLALRVMVANEQRAEPFAATFGIGEPDNNKLIAIAALDLEPATAPPRSVRLGSALGDNAFELVAGCLREKSRAVGGSGGRCSATSLVTAARRSRRERPCGSRAPRRSDPSRRDRAGRMQRS